MAVSWRRSPPNVWRARQRRAVMEIDANQSLAMVPSVADSLVGAGGGIRARDFWTLGALCPGYCSPDYESGALARLGYPGFYFH